MAEATDPKRWSDAASGAPSEVSALLREAARELPSELELQSLAQKLAPQFAASRPEPQGPGPSGAKGPPVGRLLGLLALAGIAGIVAIRVPERSSAPSASPSSPMASARAPSVQGLQVPRAPEPPTMASGEAALTGSTPTLAAPSARPSARSSGPGEAELLERARSALGAHPDRALSLTRQHKLRFPEGVLRQEREVIAIEALKRLGRAHDAEQRAGTFEKQYPDSAHRRAVETGLGK